MNSRPGHGHGPAVVTSQSDDEDTARDREREAEEKRKERRRGEAKAAIEVRLLQLTISRVMADRIHSSAMSSTALVRLAMMTMMTKINNR